MSADIVSAHRVYCLFENYKQCYFNFSLLDCSLSQNLYHLQFKQPPEGSHTGINKVETIEPVRDPSNDMEQIQHRFFRLNLYFDKVKLVVFKQISSLKQNHYV